MVNQPSNQLIRNSAATYGNSFTEDLFEQYKHYVESAEKISARRDAANNYLLTVNTFLISLYGIAAATSKLNGLWMILVPISGFLVSLTWHRIITSFRDLNTIKFKVIHRLEESMPAALYHYEWELAEHGKGTKYHPLSHLEQWIPLVFIALYGFLAIIYIPISSLCMLLT